MVIFNSFEEININCPTSVTLGKFDGLHLGHRALFDALSSPIGVFCFDISGAEELITSPEERRERFRSFGTSFLFECPFTPDIMHMEPDVFLEQLVRFMHIKKIAVGEDFHFGRDRSGDVDFLRMFTAKRGIELHVQEKLRYEGEEISSSRIRSMIKNGNIEDMSHLLGCPYFISGKVLHGRAIGRSEKVPTVNVMPDKGKLLPPFGVYASEIKVGNESFSGVSDLGKKPTMAESDEPVLLETNIFDFDREIYDENITVFLHKFIRPEIKFSGKDELYAQINKDIDSAKVFFKKS